MSHCLDWIVLLTSYIRDASSRQGVPQTLVSSSVSCAGVDRFHCPVIEADSVCSGWDACFEYEGQTYAEMRGEEKNKISHRGKALEKLKEWLKEEAA